MDAPFCQVPRAGFDSLEWIACMHSACACDAESRALTEYAGRHRNAISDC
jgi:hypothetical protein